MAPAWLFAAVLENGTVVTWGDPEWGGDSRHVQHKLRNVQQVQAARAAFAAVANGSLVTWGNPFWGGDSWGVQLEPHVTGRIRSCPYKDGTRPQAEAKDTR